MGNANILWFAQAVDDSGEFPSFKLMENLARFQRFAGIFGSHQQAMCLFQLVHWNFVKHGPRAAHSLRAALIFLDNPTSPDCRLQLHRLVELYTIDKAACLLPVCLTVMQLTCPYLQVIARAVARSVDEDTRAYILTDNQCNLVRMLI